MKKTTLYRVKAEWLYDDEKDGKRAKQLQTLADLGLQEFEKGSVLCTADQFIQLFQAGYCGTYIRPDEAVTVAASVDAGPDVEGLFRILADKIASMPSASMNERCAGIGGGCSMTPERPLDPPDHKPFTGRVTFAATVNDVDVEVKAKIFEDCIDWDTAQVWWQGSDVRPLLHSSQETAIENQFADRYDDIVRFDAE